MGFLYHWYSTGQMAAIADPVNFLTHFTGNWALWLLIVSLAVTPLRRLHPALSNLIRFRRLIGSMHSSMLRAIWLRMYSCTRERRDGCFDTDQGGASRGARDGVEGSLADHGGRRTEAAVHQVGLFAWVVLLALALTSPMFMLRWMGGKKWQRLHRLVYLAAIAGVVHYWWIVKKGVLAPGPDTVVLAVLLLARVVWSVWNKQRRREAVKPLAARS